MPFFNDIDDWREWNDNRYIDDTGYSDIDSEGEDDENNKSN